MGRSPKSLCEAWYWPLDESHEHLSIRLYYLADADTVESWWRFAMKVGEQFGEIGVIGLP